MLILDEAHNIEDICRCAYPVEGAYVPLQALLSARCDRCACPARPVKMPLWSLLGAMQSWAQL